MIPGEQHAEYMEPAEVAAELLKLATRMTRLANELLAGKTKRAALELIATPNDGVEHEPEQRERSVGRHGAVDAKIALQRAAELHEFTTSEFAYACGLEPVAAIHWLAELLARQPAVVERHGVRYVCLKKAVLTDAVREWIGKQTKGFSKTTLMRECELEGWQADEALRSMMARGSLRSFELNGFELYESPLGDRRTLGADVKVERGTPTRGTGKNSLERMTRQQRSQSKHALDLKKAARDRQDDAREKRAEEQRAKAKRQK